MNLLGKRVLVIGLGESGLAMAKWLARQGAVVRVADTRLQPPNADVLRAAVPQAELIAGPLVRRNLFQDSSDRHLARYAGAGAASAGRRRARRAAGFRNRTVCLGGARIDAAAQR